MQTGFSLSRGFRNAGSAESCSKTFLLALNELTRQKSAPLGVRLMRFTYRLPALMVPRFDAQFICISLAAILWKVRLWLWDDGAH